MGSSAAEFRAASTKTVTLSNGCELTIRRLVRSDVADLGVHVWAIFRAFTRYLTAPEDASDADKAIIAGKVEKWEKALSELGDDCGDQLIVRAAISPAVTLDGDGDEDTIPIWTIAEPEKERIQQEIIGLASGFDSLYVEEVAQRIARFRGGEAGQVPETPGDDATGGDVDGDGEEVESDAELAARGC